MKECAEYCVHVGFRRKPGAIFDEVEEKTAAMIRGGWKLSDSIIESGLGNIHLFFEREIADVDNDVPVLS
jgi:hypothetical protein